jgi:site-specific recombinase XerD
MSQATSQLCASDPLDEYQSQRRADGLSPSTIADLTRVLERLEQWTQTPLTEITEAQLLDWQAARGVDLSPAALRVRCSHVRGFYRWALAEGHVDTDPSAVLAPSIEEGRDPHTGHWAPRMAGSWPGRDRLTTGWAQMLDAFLDDELQHGTDLDQLRHHRLRVAVFAEHTGGDPSLVTGADVKAWIDGMQCSDEERHQRASSLRRFYRWAKAEGYASSNPTLATYRQVTPGPEQARFASHEWAAAFAGWAKHMRVANKSPETITLRRCQLTKLARELGVGPWEVTEAALIAWLADQNWTSGQRGIRGRRRCVSSTGSRAPTS